MIAATIGVALWRGKTISGRVLAGELLFLQNYVGSLWGHTWSLAVEEHFYIGLALLFPVLLSVRNGRGLNAIPRLFLLVAAACLTMRLLTMGYVERYAHQRFLFPTHLRIDSLFFGVLLACLYHHRQLAERTRHVPAAVLVLAGVVLMAPPFAFSLSQHKWVSVLGVIPVYMGSGLLLLAAVRVERSSNRLLLGLGALGATSYPIYLWHMAVNYWGCELLDTVVGFHWFELYAVLYFAGSCAVGYTLSKAVEWPLLRLRDRLLRGRVLREGGVDDQHATHEGEHGLRLQTLQLMVHGLCPQHWIGAKKSMSLAPGGRSVTTARDSAGRESAHHPTALPVITHDYQ